MDISGYPSDNWRGYKKRYLEILQGYLIEISMGYHRITQDIHRYLWRILTEDICLGYCKDISRISQDISKDIFWGYVQERYPKSPKISWDIFWYPYVSLDILRYPEISSGANSQMGGTSTTLNPCGLWARTRHGSQRKTSWNGLANGFQLIVPRGPSELARTCEDAERHYTRIRDACATVVRAECI